MKKHLPIIFTICVLIAFSAMAAVLQSGWTSTTNPKTARNAMGLPDNAINTNTPTGMTNVINSIAGTVPGVLTNNYSSMVRMSQLSVSNSAVVFGSLSTSNNLIVLAGDAVVRSGEYIGDGGGLSNLNYRLLGISNKYSAFNLFGDFTGTLDGSAWTNLNWTNVSGVAPTAKLGSGTPSVANYLRGDGTWSTVGASDGGATNGIQMLDGVGTNTALYNVNIASAAGAYPGNITGNAATATTAGVATYSTNLAPQHALRYSRQLGVGKTPSGSYSMSQNNSTFTLIAGQGVSGVVDSIWCVPNVLGDWTLYNLSNHVRLQIFVDMGNQTNAALMNPYLAVDIPLSHIFHNQFRNVHSEHWQNQWSSVGWDVCDMSTNFLANSALQTFNLNFKIPFTNGCFARLTNDLGGTNWSGGYITSQCSTGALSPEYAGIRLKSKSVFQQNISNTDSNYLFTIPTPGVIAELMGGIQHTQSSVFFAFVDSHGLSFWLDGANKWTSAGLDDMFKRTYGMSQGVYQGGGNGAFLGGDFGTVHYVWNDNNGPISAPPNDGAAIFEGFRQFGSDAFRWNTSLVAYTDGEQEMNNIYFTVLYYETQ